MGIIYLDNDRWKESEINEKLFDILKQRRRIKRGKMRMFFEWNENLLKAFSGIDVIIQIGGEFKY